MQAAGTGDAVVIAGKGHELGQDIGGVVYPFSDRDELLAALTELRLRHGDPADPTGRDGVRPPPATSPGPPVP